MKHLGNNKNWISGTKAQTIKLRMWTTESSDSSESKIQVEKCFVKCDNMEN